MLARRLGGNAARRLGPTGLPRAESSFGRFRGLGRDLMSGLRRVFGMPDYEAYVRHLRLCHPNAPVPSEREFFDQYVKARYGDGPTRCC